jgi:poly-gamma-glutamate capsule biosynthesis protein CapA/YwtB (metallophosphatase superfamily)
MLIQENIRLFTILFILITFLSGCADKKAVSNNPSNQIDKNKLAIYIEPYLQTDLKTRLNDYKTETLLFKTDKNDIHDVIITSNVADIPSEWTKNIIFNQIVTLSPESFNNSFKDKISNSYSIYLGMKNQSDKLLSYLTDSFSKNPPETSNITFLGDIMLSRTVEDKTKKSGNWNWPVLNIANDIKPTDLTVANLESPFSDPPKPFAHTTVFGADSKMISGLKEAAIDIVCLANNHFGDSGQKGMNLTFKLLDDNKISYFGAGTNSIESHKPLIKEINGIKFSFLGYVTSTVTPSSYAATDSKSGLNMMDINQMTLDIAEAKKSADFVIVSMHAGTEYTPDPGNEQKEFAHAAINAGADMIYGHHPHVVEAIEIYNNKPIFYSLGNFIFDQEWSEETKEGFILKSKFIYNKPVGYELVPTLIQNYGQPEIINGKIYTNILNRIMNASTKLD